MQWVQYMNDKMSLDTVDVVIKKKMLKNLWTLNTACLSCRIIRSTQRKEWAKVPQSDQSASHNISTEKLKAQEYDPYA